jgi:hypothetical protein
MFAFLARLFGRTRPPAWIAGIQVVLPADRDRIGTLEAFDAAGRTLSGPWPAVGKANRAWAAALGNPRCLPQDACGDTPTGSYALVDQIPSRGGAWIDEALGSHGVLILKPMGGPALDATRDGTGLLFLHGGKDHRIATDGSIRVPDEAMRELLEVLPPNSSRARRPIALAVRQQPGDLAPAPLPALQSRSSPAARSWFAAQARHADHRVVHRDSQRIGSDPFWNAYQSYYGRLAAPESDADIDEDIDIGADSGSVEVPDPDQAAAAALGALGYEVLQRDADAFPSQPPGNGGDAPRASDADTAYRR